MKLPVSYYFIKGKQGIRKAQNRNTPFRPKMKGCFLKKELETVWNLNIGVIFPHLLFLTWSTFSVIGQQGIFLFFILWNEIEILLNKIEYQFYVLVFLNYVRLEEMRDKTCGKIVAHHLPQVFFMWTYMFVYSDSDALPARFCRAIIMFFNIITHFSGMFNSYLDLEFYSRMCYFNVKYRTWIKSTTFLD